MMLNQQTMSILHSLKLFGLAESFEKRLADTNQASLSHAEFVGLLVQDEKTHRDNLRLRRLLKKARLRQEACLGIIRLGRHYEPERVEAAAQRALKFNACSYRSMKAILTAGLDRQHRGESPAQMSLPLHQNIRGREYYQ